jgi:hypothetical protein
MVSESLPVVDLRKCKTTKKNTENNFGLKNKFQNQEVKRREPARAFIIYTKTLPSSKGSWEKKRFQRKRLLVRSLLVRIQARPMIAVFVRATIHTVSVEVCRSKYRFFSRCVNLIRVVKPFSRKALEDHRAFTAIACAGFPRAGLLGYIGRGYAGH